MAKGMKNDEPVSAKKAPAKKIAVPTKKTSPAKTTKTKAKPAATKEVAPTAAKVRDELIHFWDAFSPLGPAAIAAKVDAGKSLEDLSISEDQAGACMNKYNSIIQRIHGKGPTVTISEAKKWLSKKVAGHHQHRHAEGAAMSPRQKAPTLSALVIGMAILATASSSRADDAAGSNWFLVKAPTGQDSKKPAEVIYAKDDGDSSTLTNAAVLWKRDLLPANSTIGTRLGASLAFAKNTLSKKRSELLTAGGNFESFIAVSNSKLDNLLVNGDFLLEDDREHHARGRAGVLDATLVAPSWLHLDPNLESGKKEVGVDSWLYPSLGLFKRRVSSTNAPAETPVGSHGGAYAGLRITARLISLNKELDVIDRFSIDASYVHVRESSVSGGYSKASYRYGEISLNYLLYGEHGGTGWKPMLGFTRSKGTNRVSNESHVNQSQISFKVSRGL